MSEPRLPVPDWSRPGEVWVVAPETAVTWTVGAEGPCDSGRCGRPAVASFRNRHHYRLVCAEHLRQSRMWIEAGRVVSWCLVAESPA